MTANHLIERLRGFLSERVEGGDMSAPLDAFTMDTIVRELPGYVEHEFLAELTADAELSSENTDEA